MAAMSTGGGMPTSEPPKPTSDPGSKQTTPNPPPTSSEPPKPSDPTSAPPPPPPPPTSEPPKPPTTEPSQPPPPPPPTSSPTSPNPQPTDSPTPPPPAPTATEPTPTSPDPPPTTTTPPGQRKARKLAEEERKQEIEEYRFNPNNDPTLPAVGMYDTDVAMKDTSAASGAVAASGGYRGWGTTSNSRHAPTNTASSGGADSSALYAREVSPVEETFQLADDEQRQGLGRVHEPTGGIPKALHIGQPPLQQPQQQQPLQPQNQMSPNQMSPNQNTSNIHRGLSNASSAYSAGAQSDMSDDMMPPGAPSGAQYYEESAYYPDGGQGYSHGHGHDQAGLGPQPVIRDVSARRNTRIESPSVFPQQGNAGIAQNF
ncbi:splicing factor 3B subunit 4 [Microsporum canis CBS 113480]|uniref:Splicing factor 3B subunit 4 n=1 Tax=Arthroderma otae (strain ATCC MYA-4605 / CBS 113480) TaxID=554155 RepID=C5FF74_ARTOC|nr:splicing factor 3B subunit 4 [Microsporum canis CBS 113480]EEQ28458.1 splicing factor 3B subunit 4 [Microsporum canis CBS 113480]